MGRFSELPKAYDASSAEDAIYASWEASGVFNPDKLPGERTEPYCIVMPPPNRTGTLHVGHAVMLAIEDLLIRFHRLRGKRALWIPGTDHAAIATQVKVEQLLRERGMKDPRKELGREKLLEKVVEFADASAKTIRNQVRKMGSSCDWSREKYTLDEERNRAVNRMFKMMYDDGIIERGYRIVNWDPQFQTTLSDDEVETKEVTAKLLTFTYDKDFPIAISTTRSETKFGDTAVAVHPSDERYKQYVGQTLTPTFCGKRLTIKVIADEAVDPAFGTGALGVTPAHSMIDAEMAVRHGLSTVQVIGSDARLTGEAGPDFAGLTVTEARTKIEAALQSYGLLRKVEDVPQNLPVAQRGGAPVEQLPMKQWFVRVAKPFALRQDTLDKWKKGASVTLKDLMRYAVESGQIKIVPDRFTKTYFHWIDNLRDWCISRQIWFGHRIPVWHHEPKCIPKPGHDGEEASCQEIVVSVEKPVCQHCDAEYVQDPDTLDTWFSSGLWTFSTLGWPRTRVVLVRHGQAEYNVRGVLDDHVDTPDNSLTEEGRKQIARLAAELKTQGATVLYSSPVRRARESAGILSQELGLEVQVDDRLREVGVGTYRGKPEVAFESARGPMKDWYETAPDGIEPFVSLKTRTRSFLDDALMRHAGETIVVVSHGDTISALGAYGTDLEWLASYPETGHSMTIEIANDGRQQNELKTYHPTNVLETGYDILFFWVARMVLMSAYALGKVPFKDVYLHGLVRDEQGRKMSKSLGNVIDPLDVIPKYGTDAVRLSLVMGTTPGQDVRLSEAKIEGFRNFTNKLWNIARFILLLTSQAESGNSKSQILNSKTLADRWILKRLDDVVTSVTSKIEKYEFSSAGEELRDFTWSDLADWYLEIAKVEKEKEAILSHILKNILILWHPFTPFVTEHVWQTAGFEGRLIVAAWPAVGATRWVAPDQDAARFETLRQLVTDMRRLRAEQGIEAAKQVEFALMAPQETERLVTENIEVVKTLARASNVCFTNKVMEGWATAVSGVATIGLNVAGSVDVAKEKEKAEKEIEATRKYVESLNIQLANGEFASKAPASVISGMKLKLSEAEMKLKTLEEKMRRLAQ